MRRGALCLALAFTLALPAVSTAADADPGLWVGTAVVNRVSRLDGTGVTRTPAPLNLRLILHVDTARQARLLKEVVLLWQEGTQNPDGTIAVPGHQVLVAADSRIPEFSGVALRDGDPVGRRISAVGFDFLGSSVNCLGRLGTSGSVTCDLTLAADAPTNPFLHRYHPDHDNLDAKYEKPAAEVNAVARHLELAFASPAVPPQGWGATVIGGTYRERVCGLAKDCLNVEGSFSLDRISALGTLVQ